MLLLVLFHQLLDHISELWPQPLESVLYIEGASSCRLQTAQPPWGVTNVFCPGQWKGQYSEILVSTGIGNTRGWKTIFKYHEDSQLLDWAVHHLVPGNTALSHGLMNWPRLRGFSTLIPSDPRWRSISPSAQLQKFWCPQNIHGSQLWPRASYAFSLWSSETGIQVPFLLWMICSLRTYFLTTLLTLTAVRGS